MAEQVLSQAVDGGPIPSYPRGVALDADAAASPGLQTYDCPGLADGHAPAIAVQHMPQLAGIDADDHRVTILVSGVPEAAPAMTNEAVGTPRPMSEGLKRGSSVGDQSERPLLLGLSHRDEDEVLLWVALAHYGGSHGPRVHLFADRPPLSA